MSGLLFSATCSEKTSKCEEQFNENCMCTMDYNPVCGCNGKTYGNACMANCAGISQYSEGACSEL